MNDQERITNLEDQVVELIGVVGTLLYQTALRGHFLPMAVNDDLVKDLDSIGDALRPTPGGQANKESRR